MADRTDSSDVRRAITGLLERPHTPGLVAAYFDPSRGFAGAMFDGLDPTGLLSHNPKDQFTADDVVAASLLDVRFGPIAVRQLLTSTDIHSALSAVPHEATLWNANEGVLTAASTLWLRVRFIEGLGRTRTSKLLARKRPQLVPIVDSVIVSALQLGSETWRPLADVLADVGLRRELDQLRPSGVDSRVGVLRVLDVMVWMSCSRSTSAVTVQRELGAPTARLLPRR